MVYIPPINNKFKAINLPIGGINRFACFFCTAHIQNYDTFLSVQLPQSQGWYLLSLLIRMSTNSLRMLSNLFLNLRDREPVLEGLNLNTFQ